MPKIFPTQYEMSDSIAATGAITIPQVQANNKLFVSAATPYPPNTLRMEIYFAYYSVKVCLKILKHVLAQLYHILIK